MDVILTRHLDPFWHGKGASKILFVILQMSENCFLLGQW